MIKSSVDYPNPFVRLGQLPTMQLFASTHCNLDCPYCSQGSARNSSLKDDLLNTPRVLSKLESWPDTHFYISGGEPLIHDGVIDFLKITSSRDDIVSFDTNGVISEKRLKQVISSLPREKFGFFNISHHILADVPLKTIQRTCDILREASIPHFVKYVGVPEIIPVIRENMNFLRSSGTGVAVTILETYADPWKGRNFPKDYTDQELDALLNMVTLGTHAMQFFGGIVSKGHKCLAGSSYVAYNMKNKDELISCCHSPKLLDWEDTVFGGDEAVARPCLAPKCLGDLMFVVGVQGVGSEVERFEQICRGSSAPLGIAQALRYVKSIADKVRLVDHERFERFYDAYLGCKSKKILIKKADSPKNEKVGGSDHSLHSQTLAGKAGMKDFFAQFKQTLAAEVKKTSTPPLSYYYDRDRWPEAEALRNFAKHKAAQSVGLPLKVNIEVTTQCVFKCEFCVLHSGALAKKRRQLFLSYEDFVKIFLQIQPFTTHIEFTGGEPLLNKDLSKMIALCNEANVKTTVATNAKLLTAKNMDKLLADPPCSLLIAYESGQVEAYEHHRIGGNLEALENNIKSFISERDKRSQAYPRVQLQTVVSRETVEHMDTFWRDAELLDVDEACSKPIFVWPDGDEKYWKLMIDKYLIPDHPLSYYTTDEHGKIKETGVSGCCPNISNVHIGADGSIIPCWYNLLTSPDVGNALDDSFIDLWFSDNFMEVRKAMKNHTAYDHGCRYCIGIHKPELFQRKTFRSGGKD